ncbi:MAG: hypothetical protein AAFQ02_09355 [Bacteroidota bacterium]
MDTADIMTQKEEHFEKAIQWVKSKTKNEIKARHEGYEDPKSFTNASTDEVVMPDITFTSDRGRKHYTDIVIKSDHPQQLITKWKLLSTMASMKQGKLHLLAPRGHKSFADRLIEQYHIEATVHAL